MCATIPLSVPPTQQGRGRGSEDDVRILDERVRVPDLPDSVVDGNRALDDTVVLVGGAPIEPRRRGPVAAVDGRAAVEAAAWSRRAVDMGLRPPPPPRGPPPRFRARYTHVMSEP